MKNNWYSEVIRFCCAVLLGILMSAGVSIAAPAVGTGVFPNAQLIETNLVRDESTRTDVQQLLGIPTGSGGALLPGFGEGSNTMDSYDVWYYEDVGIDNIKSEDGVLAMDMRQQILMVFFKGDKFYGYFWTSNSADIEGNY